MQQDFDGALKFVLAAEGGYSDDPYDPGGATNLGIEQTEYQEWLRKQGLPVVPVTQITTAQAGEIYRTSYWEPVHGDYLQGQVAYVMFDTGVNQGVGAAIEQLQRVLGVPVTSEFDNNTSTAYHAFIAAHSGLELANGVLSRRVLRYRLLVSENPALGKFLDGWLNRVNSLRLLIEALPKS